MSWQKTKAASKLTQKTVKGVFWSYLSFVGGKGLGFLSTIILARLLLPGQFGLIGYCLLVIQYVDIINSAGIDTALIARRENIQEAANAGSFWIDSTHAHGGIRWHYIFNHILGDQPRNLIAGRHDNSLHVKAQRNLYGGIQ